MKTQSFKESDIEFTFGADWAVKKYDDHAYFKMLSGHGLKGVDFIGIYKNESLYLIEVKNYHKRSYSPVDPDWSDIEGGSPPLGAHLYGKMEDSLRLIRIVNKYLSTRWWFKMASYFRRTFKKEALQKDWHFWTRVGELSQDPASVHPVLWLEMDPKLYEPSDLRIASLTTRLQNEYAKGKALPTQPLQVVSIKEHRTKAVMGNLEVLRRD